MTVLPQRASRAAFIRKTLHRVLDDCIFASRRNDVRIWGAGHLDHRGLLRLRNPPAGAAAGNRSSAVGRSKWREQMLCFPV